MRWCTLVILVALGWFAYTLTPFWSLYELARAVEARDTQAVAQRINFRTLRLSLARQLTAAVRFESARLDARDRQRLGDAAAALSLPLVESLVTPENVVDLLDDGWPQDLDLPGAPPPGHGGLRIPNLGRLLGFYGAADMRGFRSVVIAVPPDRPRERQFRLRMRLRGFSWRLVEIDLAESVRTRIAERLAAGAARLRRAEPRTPSAGAPAEMPP